MVERQSQETCRAGGVHSDTHPNFSMSKKIVVELVSWFCSELNVMTCEFFEPLLIWTLFPNYVELEIEIIRLESLR